MRLHPARISALLAITALTAAACASGDDSVLSTTTPTTEPPPWNYPPAEHHAEIAIPLDERTSAAAYFAMQYEIDGPPALDDPALAASLLARVSPDEALPEWSQPSGVPIPVTGGDLHKTVGANMIDDDGTIEFTLCRYLTPGLFYRDPDTGESTPSGNHLLYTLSRPRVRFTTENAADGRTTTEPRWLVVGHGEQLIPTTKRHLIDETCQPHMPDPFIQTTPTPTAPPETPR